MGSGFVVNQGGAVRVFVKTNQPLLDQVIEAVVHQAQVTLGDWSTVDMGLTMRAIGIVDWSALDTSQKQECLYLERYYTLDLIDISGTLPIRGRRRWLPTPFFWPDLIKLLKGDLTFVRG